MSESLAVRLGRQIAAARYRSRQSQRELAEQCGLSQSRLSRIEMGKGVTFDDIEALAAALKVPVSTLVRGAEGGPPRTAIQRRPLGLLQQAVGRLQRELERFSDGVSDTESHFVSTSTETRGRPLKRAA